MKTSHYLWRMICYRPILYAIDASLWLLIHLTPLIPGLIIQQFFNRLQQIGHLNTELWLLIALLVSPLSGIGRVASLLAGCCSCLALILRCRTPT